MVGRPSKTWGWLGCSPKRSPGPAFGDGVVPVERAVYRGGSYFQHQMGAPRRPAHLLLRVHSAVREPLHRALGDRRRNRFFASAGCGVVDDDVGLSGYVGLEIAQKARHLARGRFDWRRIVSRGVKHDQSFANEIERAPDQIMPETPTDPLDGLGEASARMAITLRGVRPTLGRLGGMLIPHREMKPVENVMGRSGAGGFAEGPRAVGTITQDGDRYERPSRPWGENKAGKSSQPLITPLSLCSTRSAVRTNGRQTPQV